MSIKIEIFVPDHDPVGNRIDKRALLTEDMAALGFERAAPTAREAANAEWRAATDAADELVAQLVANLAETAPAENVEQPAAPADDKPKRTRRTKAEMEAARAAEAAPAADTPQISTGGERIGPEDSPEVQAQDAADEAAEVEANRKPDAPLTHDDLRKAVGLYIKKFGMPAATANVHVILGRKQADVPDTQEALAEAIAKIEAAVAGEAPAAEPEPAPEPAKQATKADALAALKAYAKTFDGRDDLGPETTPIASEDFGKLLKLVFAERQVGKLSDVPDEPAEWARLIEGIREMHQKNPFGRSAK